MVLCLFSLYIYNKVEFWEMGIQKASSMHYGLAFLLTTKELMINVKSLELRTRIIEKKVHW